MDQELIRSMVRALKPTLSRPERAKAILERFWSTRIALVWDVQDVHRAANERRVALTSKEAVKILKDLHYRHNKQYGLKWEDLTNYIDEHALGRKLTQSELKRFVEKRIIAVHRPR